MAVELAKIITMNGTLLKELSLEEVFEFHPLFDAQAFPYQKARKVKPIKARPINTILDKSKGSHSVWEKLLLATLEGHQSLKRDSFVCWGVNNDVWQQRAQKLHEKYTPVETDVDGWTTYVPKEGDEAVMNAFQLTEASILPLGENFGTAGGFSITNPRWGDERVAKVREVPIDILSSGNIFAGAEDAKMALAKNPEGQVVIHLHYGVAGDWVLQSPSDHKDIYRIAKAFFDATYEVE